MKVKDSQSGGFRYWIQDPGTCVYPIRLQVIYPFLMSLYYTLIGYNPTQLRLIFLAISSF